MNVVLIHGCPEIDSETEIKYNEQHWLLWVKLSLEKRGIKVDNPLMPNAKKPVYEDYKRVLNELEINQDTVLVGHSCGGSLIIRYIQDMKKRVSKVIMVAPWKFNDEGTKYHEDFYNYEIEPFVKSYIEEVVYFTSDNEEDAGKKSLEIFQNILGGKTINIQNHGHYVEGEMGTNEFPELIEEIIS